MTSRMMIVGGLLLAFAPTASMAATSATPHHHAAAHAAPAPKVAPADEYFGRMKMSILGITNSIHDTGIREGFDPTNAGKYFNSLALTENALEDWTNKYPQDSWIPRRAYDLSHEFWLMHTPAGNTQAQRCRAILFRRFPRNHWTVAARGESASTVAPVAVGPAISAPAKQQQQ